MKIFLFIVFGYLALDLIYRGQGMFVLGITALVVVASVIKLEYRRRQDKI
ncbi:hypothetical protein L0244_39950 [bacterium]|nr:hypothetical protein [bacterium]